MTASPPIRAVIVDDEELARRVLREYLTAGHPDVDVVAECANGFEAVKAVADHVPDLLFLDIQMPKLDGFEVLELVGRDVAVIFVTAYDEYALKAFEVHAIDYLLKPFGRERLAQALDQLRQRTTRAVDVPIDTLTASARPPGRSVERVLVRDGAKVHVIPIDRLDYVEAQDDYICLRSEGRQFLKDQTLGSLEAGLDPSRFVRIHRSYLINLDRIVRLEPETRDSRVAVLKDGTRLPVSRAGYARLSSLL